LDVPNAPQPPVQLCAAVYGQSKAAAYQLINSGQYQGNCYPLTGDLSAGGFLTKSFFDASNPARGWKITASGGSATNCGGQSRTFTWNFMCQKTIPVPPFVSDNYTFVTETDQCSYSAFMYSQVGCPLRMFF
jgi:hypothetical protein